MKRDSEEKKYKKDMMMNWREDSCNFWKNKNEKEKLKNNKISREDIKQKKKERERKLKNKEEYWNKYRKKRDKETSNWMNN